MWPTAFPAVFCLFVTILDLLLSFGLKTDVDEPTSISDDELLANRVAE